MRVATNFLQRALLYPDISQDDQMLGRASRAFLGIQKVYPKFHVTSVRMASTAKQIKINTLPRSLYPSSFEFSPLDFKRIDESSDTQWYSQPRFVQHIDDGAIEALKSYYGSIISPNSSVLDVCSSWVSHLAASLKPRSMVGYGMNAAELHKNQHLTKYFVKDLNVTPDFKEVEEKSVDVLICNVSIDYLTKPIEVLGEMRRILKIGGTAHMAFSNRCFPTKVIGKWSTMSDEDRRRWVGGYFWASGGWKDIEEVILKDGSQSFMGIGGEDPLFVVRGTRGK